MSDRLSEIFSRLIVVAALVGFNLGDVTRNWVMRLYPQHGERYMTIALLVSLSLIVILCVSNSRSLTAWRKEIMQEREDLFKKIAQWERNEKER